MASRRSARVPQGTFPSWLMFDLGRPEYPPTPQIFQSAMAWSILAPGDERTRGLVYRPGPSSEKDKKKIEIRGTDPLLTAADQREWEARVRANRYPQVASSLLLDAIEGQKNKSAVTFAAPITPALALLQNRYGAMGKSSPVDFAKIIETCFAAGNPAQAQSRREASLLWYRALRRRIDNSSFLRWLDKSMFEAVVSKIVSNSGEWPPAEDHLTTDFADLQFPKWWTPAVAATTPFGWLRRAWVKICEPEWTETLPPRRWSDWASALLRTGLGFSYLWECHFYLSLGRAVLDGTKEGVEVGVTRALFRAEPLFPWALDPRDSQPNILSRLLFILRTGLRCRQIITTALAELASPPNKEPETLAAAFEETVSQLSDDAALKQELQEAFSPRVRPPGFKNLEETVRYSLTAREGEETAGRDPYCFLRTRGKRTVVVEPGAEWLVVIAAMAAGAPGRSCRQVDLQSELNSLGLRPRQTAVLAELKRAGLCEGAADADEGIVIHSPFPLVHEVS